MAREFVIKTSLEFIDFRFYVTKSLSDYISNNNNFKPFLVKIEPYNEKKTQPQLRGFFRLCSLIASELSKLDGTVWDKNRVRYFIQSRAGYIEYFKGVVTPKSLKNITKDNMSILINEIIVFGNEMGIEDCTLTKQEEEDFNNYYELKEEK